MQLSFKNLPFVPNAGQVIYTESAYNKELNLFIRENYELLKTKFKLYELNFCYFPLQAKEVINYHAPYLTEDKLKKYVEGVPSLAKFAITDAPIPPSLFFTFNAAQKDEEGNVVLQYVEINLRPTESIYHAFHRLIAQIKAVKEEHYELTNDENQCSKPIVGKNKYSLAFDSLICRFNEEDDYLSVESTSKEEQEVFINHNEQKSNLCYSACYDIPKPDSNQADRDFEVESQKLITEIKDRIQTLQKMGVNTLFLRELIEEQPRLSRMRITKDFRIILVDYNELEIRMLPLPKAVFLLFLRHPEGIRFKELSDYAEELLQIYVALHPNGTAESHRRSIRDITDSTKNSINEKCARIRETFLKHFNEYLAHFYFVTGLRGEPKRIKLDRSLVSWD